MKKFLSYICCSEIGLIEFLLALYPLLCGYKLFGILLAYSLILFIALLAIATRGVKSFTFKPFLYFGGYVIIHNFLYLGIIDNISMSSAFVTQTIGMGILIISCRYIAPVIEFKKLMSSISIVSLVCMIGLFYHVVLLASGNYINTIPIPFMPEQGEESRLLEEHFRPVSFFFEPQSYVMYMLVPMFYYFHENKFIISAIIGLSILLSGSTTGIFVIGIILATFFINKSMSLKYKVVTVLFGIILIFFLGNSQYTQVGFEKLNNTELSSDIRTSNGSKLFENMDYVYILTGAPYSNATQMAKITGNINVVFLQDSVFIPAFWIGLIFYGLIGSVLFYNIYWNVWKINLNIRPYVLCIVACTFSNPDFLGASMIYSLIFMISFSYYYNFSINQKHG